MERTITATDLHGEPGTVTTWIDDSVPDQTRFCIKVEVGPFSVAYLDHEAVVALIKDASSAARVVD
jgi:hypothetical protein